DTVLKATGPGDTLTGMAGPGGANWLIGFDGSGGHSAQPAAATDLTTDLATGLASDAPQADASAAGIAGNNLVGSAGTTPAFAVSGENFFYGGSGPNFFNGGHDGDFFVAGTGLNDIDASDGFDTVSYQGHTDAVSLSVDGNGDMVSTDGDIVANA